MAIQRAEIAAIIENPAAPTAENTLDALERSGQMLERVSRVFFGMASANTNDAIEAIRSEMAPKLSAHHDAILLDERLFALIKTLYEQSACDLRSDGNANGNDSGGRSDSSDGPAARETARLIRETYKDFARAGALLSSIEKDGLRSINTELASLQTTFSQNVLNEVNAKAVIVDSSEELAGLTEGAIKMAAEVASARGLPGKYVLVLRNTSVQPVLASLENRALRQRIHETSLARGSSSGEFDNRAILSRIATLRADRAELLGYENHAAYSLADQTAKTTQAVNHLLADLTPPAVANAGMEAAELQARIHAEGETFELAPWDWAYYSERVRQERYDFDESQLKPYLELERVLENGLFYVAREIYGLSFKPRPDLPVYHPDAKIWEVLEEDGSTLALFLGDYYARPTKRGGAWMNAFVSQSRLLSAKPVIANTLNVAKPADGQATLLTWDEVTTLFHEFGHALHGMFSDVRYPSFSGTSVPRDFVEFPSQVSEMWSSWPEVIRHYAVHYETGEPMPAELLKKVLAAEKFNQGFATTEYLAASLLDQAWHQAKRTDLPDEAELLTFEAAALSAAGVAIDVGQDAVGEDAATRVNLIPPRYRSTYFSHIVGGYSASYYAYIWSEVLDADAVDWFKHNGGMKRANGEHFRNTVLSRGGSEDPMTLYRAFRGKDPDLRYLLERRGLNAAV